MTTLPQSKEKLMKSEKIQPLKGYTLIEALLVLLVMAAFTLLPVLGVKNWQEDLLTYRFFNRFEKLLLTTQQVAIVEGRQTSVTCKVLSNQKIQVSFNYGRQMGSNPEEQLYVLLLPENITGLASMKQLTFHGGSGNPSHLLAYSFHWPKKQATISYQYQMGSGRFVKKME